MKISLNNYLIVIVHGNYRYRTRLLAFGKPKPSIESIENGGNNEFSHEQAKKPQREGIPLYFAFYTGSGGIFLLPPVRMGLRFF